MSKVKVILTVQPAPGTTLAMKGAILGVDLDAGTLDLSLGKVRGAKRTISISLITKVIPTKEAA